MNKTKTAKPVKNIYQKLQQARVELQDLKLKKTGSNQKIKYYELSDFLPAVNRLCEKHGMMTGVSILRRLSVEVAILTIVNSEEPQDGVEFVLPTVDVALPRGQAIQGLGAKVTYMRRYLLMVAFEIVESDNVDSINRDLADELNEAEIGKIANAKDFAELTKICGGLKQNYKAELIKPFYDMRKEELENKVIKKKENNENS